MSTVVVMTFDKVEDANDVRQKVKQLERNELINLEDAAVIAKDQDGKVHVVDEGGKSVKTGAVVGGILGLCLALVFPVAGIVVGAAGGALLGKSLDRGIDKAFIKEVSAALEPGGSALFLVVDSANRDAALTVLQPYRGHAKLYHTNLDAEDEETLRRVLEK